MAQPKRTPALYHDWVQWAMAGPEVIKSGHPAVIDLYLKVTMLVTIRGMYRVGIRPASHPTTTTKD